MLCLLLGSVPTYTQEYPAITISAELKKDADAIVRLERTEVEIRSLDDVSIRKTRVVTILRRRGNSQAGAFVTYDNSRKIKSLEARVYNLIGEEIEKFKARDFNDMSAVPGGTLYSDDRVKYLDYTPVQYPYTIAISYELQLDDSALVPSWFIQDDYRLSVEQSDFELLYSDPALEPVVSKKNLESLQLTEEITAGRKFYQVTNALALRPEPYSKPFGEWCPKMMVRMPYFKYDDHEGQISDWSDLGRWMHHQILDGRSDLPPSTIAAIRSLVAGVSDPIEKAKIVYRYVQENTRYISVQVGIGGIQPIAAEEVDRLKYGDCKGLTNYTMALLEAVGVPAYYTHVEAGADKIDFDPDFADLAQGNHVILAIPDGDQYQWVDCTSQTSPFGFLGRFTDDRLVHIIREDGGALVRTPAYLDDFNSLLTTATMSLTSEGHLQGETTLLSGGTQYDEHYGLEMLSRDDQELHYKKYWSYVNNLRLADITFENKKEELEFEERIEWFADNYATPTGDLLFLHPNVLNRFTHIPDRVRNRSRDFRLSRGFTDRDSFLIKLPVDIRVEAIPEPVQLTTIFGSYYAEVTYDQEEHALQYSRAFSLKNGTHAPGEYDSFREFCREVGKADNAQVVLKKVNQPNQ